MIIVEPAFTILNPQSKDDALAMLRRVEFAGRVCYKSEDRVTPDSYHRFIQMLMQKNHWSVIEHATMTAHIVTNRGVTHELVRHRIASFSQESTRYCNYNKGKFGGEITVVAPRELGEADREIWRATMESSEQAYLELIQRGASPQIARGVLPNDLKAEIVVTANLREWHHLFALRCAPNAHPHIRHVMQIGLAQAVEMFTPVFDDLKELCVVG
ncbi:MAG: FAD-dependent thymidylate synthase [Chloroflexi bacterium]|nr:FAD-dependent thymidylate synthase [Chloroflexota bacterium]